MQPLLSLKVVRSKLFATKLHLHLAAAITIVLLVIFFSAGVQSESGAGVGTSPTICPNQLLQNGDFELSGYPYSTAPQNCNTRMDLTRAARLSSPGPRRTARISRQAVSR